MQNPKKKILIVDDAESNLIFLSELLTYACGYQVICANDGVSALKLAQQELPDLILLDIMMPHMDGLEVCHRLKQLPRVSKIPIIFITVRSDIKDKVAGFLSGGVDYITRPFDSDELIARIRNHLEIYRLRNSLEKMIELRSHDLQEIQSSLDQSNAFLVEYEAPNKQILSLLEEGVIKLNQSGICLSANEAAARILGYVSPEHLIGKYIQCSQHGIKRSKTSLVHQPEVFLKPTYENNAYWIKQNGDLLPVEYRTQPVQTPNNFPQVTISFIDISARKAVENKLYRLAYQDDLTGLCNRFAFFELLNMDIERFKKNQTNLAILLLDLDHFKEINDSMGHAIGDKILRLFADQLVQIAPDANKVARLGGDEFVVIISGFYEPEEVNHFCEKMLESINRSYLVEASQIIIKSSIGVFIYHDPQHTAEDVLINADLALYHAKDNNRGGYCLFRNEMLDSLAYELEITQDFIGIINRNELYIEYQAQFDLLSSRYIGAEALVRWNHPKRGLLMPSDFLPIAEKRGYIKEISDWVLAKVIEQIREWRDKQHSFGQISINICAKQLADEHFEEQIRSLILAYNIEPSDVVLELTENVLINTSPRTQNAIQNLANWGVTFAIDDFGTGYSSLQLLKRLHSDKIKIDCEFVANIANDSKSAKIIQALIHLADALDMGVIAEGVEDKVQVDFLVANGCSTAQGFYFSQSLSAAQLERCYF